MYITYLFYFQAANTAYNNNLCFFWLEPLTDTFLMMVAQHELTSDQLVHLSVLFGMTHSVVQEIIRDSEGMVSSTFAILESWKNNMKAVSPGDMYEILCVAYLELKNTDVTGYIRSGECLTVTLSSIVRCCIFLRTLLNRIADNTITRLVEST